MKRSVPVLVWGDGLSPELASWAKGLGFLLRERCWQPGAEIEPETRLVDRVRHPLPQELVATLGLRSDWVMARTQATRLSPQELDLSVKAWISIDSPDAFDRALLRSLGSPRGSPRSRERWRWAAHHELRNALSNMVGFAEILQTKGWEVGASPERAQDALGRIAANARRSLGILADTSLIWSLEEKSNLPDEGALRLKDVWARIHKELQSAPPVQGVRLESEELSEDLWVQAPDGILECLFERLFFAFFRMAGSQGRIRTRGLQGALGLEIEVHPGGSPPGPAGGREEACLEEKCVAYGTALHLAEALGGELVEAGRGSGRVRFELRFPNPRPSEDPS